jgi:hypothetical protein
MTLSSGVWVVIFVPLLQDHLFKVPEKLTIMSDVHIYRRRMYREFSH